MLDKKIRAIIVEMSNSLIEREEALRLLLLATLSGEHILLFGPPGTAKSEVARRISLVFDQGNYFERLLTRFSVPEELFGPLSIKALENDEYTRLTHNYLPDASIAFIDEIFKANSAILNTLLTLLNERQFDNGDKRIKTPLISVVAASNELPSGEELEALYDRFLFRLRVNPVSDEGFKALLNIRETAEVKSTQTISKEEISDLNSRAKDISLSDDVVYLLQALKSELNSKNIYVSDRRWRKVVKILKISALTNNYEAVTIWDCWLLQHCLWSTPKQQELIFNWYKDHIGTNKSINLTSINKLVEVWKSTLEDQQQSMTPVFNQLGEQLYITPQGGTTTESGQEYFADRDGEPLYNIPLDEESADKGNPNNNGLTRKELEASFFDDYYQQRHIDGKWVNIESYVSDPQNRFKKRFQYDLYQEPTTYSQDHINEHCAELNILLLDIKDYYCQTENMLSSVSTELSNHLWIDSDFQTTAENILKQNLMSLNKITETIQQLHNDFKALPLAA